jgi:hypothetical protein
MHSRLFEPLNGWRGFLGDIAVVVIGVLLALFAQEIAQGLRWRTDVAAQRAALQDMAQANLQVIAFRRFQEPCVERRVGEVQTVLRLHKSGQPIRLAGPVGLPYKWGTDTGAWNIALADATLSHMPLVERKKFGNAVDVYDNVDALMKQEYAVWLRLQPLDDPDLLESADWALLRQALGEARALDARIKVVVAEALTSNNLGLPMPEITEKDVPTEEEWGNAFCRPLLVPERN